MAVIVGGVPVGGFMSPTDSTDVYAVTDEKYSRGGWRTVASLAERDAITTDRRTVGMLVNVLGDQVYELGVGLTNSDWTVFSPGGSSSHSALTTRGVLTGTSTSPVSLLTGITGTIDKIIVTVLPGNEGTGDLHFDLTVASQTIMPSGNSDLSQADQYVEIVGKEVTGENLDAVFTSINGTVHFIVYYSVD